MFYTTALLCSSLAMAVVAGSCDHHSLDGKVTCPLVWNLFKVVKKNRIWTSPKSNPNQASTSTSPKNSKTGGRIRTRSRWCTWRRPRYPGPGSGPSPRGRPRRARWWASTAASRFTTWTLKPWARTVAAVSTGAFFVTVSFLQHCPTIECPHHPPPPVVIIYSYL
jgi:hypothetical protein